MARNIPIRVIPGRAEVVRCASSYHLNVGFHLSLNVQELVQEMAKLENLNVEAQAQDGISFAPARVSTRERSWTPSPAEIAKMEYQKKISYSGKLAKFQSVEKTPLSEMDAAEALRLKADRVAPTDWVRPPIAEASIASS